MKKDPIVEEVRKYRKKHSSKFDNNINKICKDLKKIEARYANKLVSFDCKRLSKS